MGTQNKQFNRRRKKQGCIKRIKNKIYWTFWEIKHSKRNATAAHSANYILEDLNHEKGIAALSELSGLPEGVIIEALKNICVNRI